MKKILRKILKKIKKHMGYYELEDKLNSILILLGQLRIENMKKVKDVSSLSEVEFKIFSQWGQDGIIQYLVTKIDIPRKIFVEFGVGNYTESNTRFLLMNNNWSGLVIDSSRSGIDYIRDEMRWKYDLETVCALITKDNINKIIKEYIMERDIGLLSIDIDGNDYWIWKEIDVIKPRIIICEYNSTFGCDHFVTVPYDKNFNRTKKHHSNVFFGASLPALCLLAEEKGYDFVGCNSVGNDAFFVRKDLSSPFRVYNFREGYIARHRKSRDIKGNEICMDRKDLLKEMFDMEIFDIKSKKHVLIKELFRMSI